MSKKKLIIILVFVAIIIGFVMYNSKKTTNENSTAANGDNSNGTYLANPIDPNTGKQDPQTKQTYSSSWYTSTARSLYNLFDGFTSDEEEAKIIRLIAQCKTRQDIELLKQAYDTVDKKYDLEYRVADDIADGGCLPELNAALRKSGCDYQF